MRSIFVLLAAVFSFSAFSALEFTPDVPAAVKKQMLDDLTLISSIKGSGQTPLHQQIFGTVSGSTFKKFFESRMQSVGMGCGGGSAVACVKPFLSSNQMFLTENYIKFSHPAIARLMIIFHEARHGEAINGNWTHANCPIPFVDEKGKEIKSIWTGATLAGEDACDISPLGSYGSSTIMLKNIAKFCTNCNAKMKLDADIYAADQLKRISNKAAKVKMVTDFAVKNN
jgi:hypothetical protein